MRRRSRNTERPLPEPLLASIRKNKVALKGPITTPIGEGFTSVNVGLRKALALYANLRPVWNLPSVPSRFQNVDLVIVRENTEDLYAGLEHEVVKGVVESLKIITEEASTKIARFAFEYARRHKRRRVTAVHKANIMKLSDGLFIACARTIAKEYADIQYDERIVDAACMHLVMHPEKFDVLLLPNLYGDIVSDLCAGSGGWSRRRARGKPGGRRRRRVRSRAWFGTRHRRAEQSKSDGAAVVGRAHAASSRRRREGRPHHEGVVGRVGGRLGTDRRHRRHGDDDAVHGRDLSGAPVVTKATCYSPLTSS